MAVGSVALSREAQDILSEVVMLLGKRGNPITVEGYTDSIPVDGSRFRSNWELSAARAAALVAAFEGLGVAPDRLAAVGYGEQHPVATNAAPAGRARNRRVAVIVARDADGQHGLTSIGAQRAEPIEISWRQEVEEAASEGTQAVRRDDGSVLFTAPGQRADAPVPD